MIIDSLGKTIKVLITLGLAGLLLGTSFGVVKSMETIDLIRLGNVNAGLVLENDDSEKVNDYTPVILANGNAQPTVLYASYEKKTAYRKSLQGTHMLDRLDSNGSGFSLSEMFDGYPIKFKSKIHNEKEARSAETIDFRTIMTGDLDGDGRSELLFVNNPLGINVYSSEKALYQYSPATFDPNTYRYEVSNVHKAHTGNKDIFFYAIARNVHEGEKPGTKNLAPYLILYVDNSGVKSITLKYAGSMVSSVYAVGAIKSAGSTSINSFVVCATLSNKEGLHIVRYNLEGRMIGEPRLWVNDDYPLDALSFLFVESAEKLVLHNAFESQLILMDLAKDDDWIQTFEAENEQPLGQAVLGGGLNRDVVLSMDHNEFMLYCRDNDGNYYISDQKKIAPVKQRVGLYRAKPASPKHQVMKLLPVPGHDGRFIQLDSRQPSFDDMSDDELIWAGKRFLPDEIHDYCAEEGRLEFDELLEYKVDQLKESKGIDQTIQTLDQVAEHFPDFFNEQRQAAYQRYREALENALLKNISRDALIDMHYKMPDKYYQWLESHFVPGEMVLLEIDMFGTVYSQRPLVNHFMPPDIDTSKLGRTTNIQYTQTPVGTYLALALKNGRLGGLEELAAYYLIKWTP